jgi:four helix bundle protein
MRNFKELKIWQKGFDIASKSFQLVSSFPKEEKFGLSIQITRAAVSIPSNIAEGSSRSSDKDYNRFLQIALGSAFELETQILLAGKADFGNKELREDILSNITEEQRMISGFMQRLKT